LAVANYHDTYGSYPPAVTYDAGGHPAHSWRILVLPFLEQRKLYNAYSFAEPWDGPNNSKLATRMPTLFAFDGTYESGKSTFTNFVAITGAETLWPPGTGMIQSNIGDGSSNTIQFAEYNGPAIHWMSPMDLEFGTMSFLLGDPAGIDSQYLDPAVSMADGAVQRLGAEITPEELRAMCTANGHESELPDSRTEEMEDARLRLLKPTKNPTGSEPPNTVPLKNGEH
jgi:hypothetical protein